MKMIELNDFNLFKGGYLQIICINDTAHINIWWRNRY